MQQAENATYILKIYSNPKMRVLWTNNCFSRFSCHIRVRKSPTASFAAADNLSDSEEVDKNFIARFFKWENFTVLIGSFQNDDNIGYVSRYDDAGKQ